MSIVEQPMSLRDRSGVLSKTRAIWCAAKSLARTEVEQKVDRVTAGVISVFGAMMLAYAGLIIVLIAAA